MCGRSQLGTSWGVGSRCERGPRWKDSPTFYGKISRWSTLTCTHPTDPVTRAVFSFCLEFRLFLHSFVLFSLKSGERKDMCASPPGFDLPLGSYAADACASYKVMGKKHKNRVAYTEPYIMKIDLKILNIDTNKIWAPFDQ